MYTSLFCAGVPSLSCLLSFVCHSYILSLTICGIFYFLLTCIFQASLCLIVPPSLKTVLDWMSQCMILGRKIWKAFVDVRVFNPSAPSWPPLIRISQEKRRQYDQRVREVEHATFTILVLSTKGGMGRAATTFYKRLASMVAEKEMSPMLPLWIGYDADWALHLWEILSCPSGEWDHPAIIQPPSVLSTFSLRKATLTNFQLPTYIHPI